jgi:hypothetical protein
MPKYLFLKPGKVRSPLVFIAALFSISAWGATVSVNCPPEISFAPFTVTGQWSAPSNPVALKGNLDLNGVRVTYTAPNAPPKVSTIHCTYKVPSVRMTRNLTGGEVGSINTNAKPWTLSVLKNGAAVREEKLPAPYSLTLSPTTMKLDKESSAANVDLADVFKKYSLVTSYALVRGGVYGNGGKSNPYVEYSTPGSASNPESWVTIFFNTYLNCSGNGKMGLSCQVP